MDYGFVRRHCDKIAKSLFEDFDRKRRAILTDVAREFHPIGVAGLVKEVEELADEDPYDEEHRLLTTRPVECLRKGAAGFHGNLTSPARRWFRLRRPSFDRAPEDEGADRETASALDRLTDAVEWVFSRGRVYPQLYRLYEHLLCYGFACMLVTSDKERVVKARTLRVGTYALGVGEDGMVCRVARKFSWTAEQILRQFGERGCPESIRTAARRADDKRRWTVLNLIEPTMSGDLRAYDRVSRELELDDSMVFRSVYWLDDGKDGDPQGGILDVSGFTVNPIIAPRLEAELGDTYGRGRGMDALDLARGVQTFKHDMLTISGIRAKPPVVASAEFKDEGLRLSAGSVNYARFGEQRAALVTPALAQPPDSTEIREAWMDAEQEIADCFFNSAFATIDALKNNPGVKTATEVDALVRENMERLNPVVTNLDTELLDPLVSVMASYTLSAGVMPLTDEDVAQLQTVDVEYVSQIHLSAKQSQLGAINTWLQAVGGIAQMKPDATDKVDGDGVADTVAEMLGVPAKCRAGDEAVAMARQQRAQQQAQAQQMAQMQAMGEMAAKAGGMPTDEGHLGSALMQGLGGEG